MFPKNVLDKNYRKGIMTKLSVEFVVHGDIKCELLKKRRSVRRGVVLPGR